MIGGEFVASGNTGGSVIGPERALEAINKTPRAQRESGASFELPCERRSGPAEPSPAHGNFPAIPNQRIFRHHPQVQNRKSFPDPVC